LRVLWLDFNSIADLSPLAPLGNLSQVTATGQNITLPRISVTRGSELRVASARGLNGELAAITGTSPDHGTSSEGIATWKDIAKAGDHALTFSSEPLLGRSSGTQGRISGRNASSLASAPSADVAVTYSGTLTQPVVVRDPAPTPETESTTPATPAAVDEASSTSDTGATPAVISTPPELARTGTDVTGLILTIILCALIGAGALIGVQKRRHLHRISTSL
jgi:LPXTG-motif cell wall-anchored protein